MEEKSQKNNITPETIEEFKKIFKSGKLTIYSKEEYPNIVELENELDSSSRGWFIYYIKNILNVLDESNISKGIEDDIKVRGFVSIEYSKVISPECLKVLKSEYGNFKDFSSESFANKYPEYFEQLKKHYVDFGMRDCQGVANYINSEKYRELIKALLPAKNLEKDVDEKMDVIMYYYIRYQLKYFSNEDKGTILKFFSEHFKPNLTLNEQKVGFTDLELEFVKNAIKFFSENGKEIPGDTWENFGEWVNNKFSLDIQEIMENQQFEDFNSFNNWYSFFIENMYKNMEFDEEELETINELLKVTDRFSLEQVNKLNCFEDIIICFTDSYKKFTESNEEKNTPKEVFYIINRIFENYLNKCNNPNDLLNDIPSRCIQLINSEFLPDNYREKLIEIYNRNYKDRCEEKNKRRIKEIETQNPTIIEKIEKRESLTDEEYEIFEELACLERANNGIFKEEYIDYILKREVETNFLKKDQKENIAKRLIEDKVTYILRNYGLQNYHVSIVEAEYLATNSVVGNQNSYLDRIRFYKKYVCENNIIDISNVIFHEIQHAIQFKQSYGPNNFLLYDILKDECLVNKYGDDYYRENYEHMKFEVDARIAANIKLMEYLQDIGVEDKRIVDLVQKFNINQELENDNQKKRENLMEVDKSKLVASSDYLFQQMILENPKMLEKMPQALFEFNANDGKRKGNISILQEYYNWCIENDFSEEQIILNEFGEDSEKVTYYGQEKKAEEREIAELFVHIINNDAIVPNDEIINDMKLLSSLNSTSKKICELRDMVIKKDILPRIEYWINEGMIPTELNMPLIEEGITVLENFAINIDNKEFSESILKQIQEFRNKSFQLTETLGVNEELKYLQELSKNFTSSEISEGKKAIKAIADFERSGVKIDEKDGLGK